MSTLLIAAKGTAGDLSLFEPKRLRGVTRDIRVEQNATDNLPYYSTTTKPTLANKVEPASSRKEINHTAAHCGYSTKSANVCTRLLLPYLENKVSRKALCIDQYINWNLGQEGVDSAVSLDADTLVRRNFDSPFNFAAVPDVYDPSDPRASSITFNAGVLAFRPSSVVFENMREKMEVAEYPLQQAEQAFLNLYFGGTPLRLPYIYNANLAISHQPSLLGTISRRDAGGALYYPEAVYQWRPIVECDFDPRGNRGGHGAGCEEPE
ncbi:hypothetical protein K438DRAFT_1781986 [Mycena galopus ATCC 62051]|nr:hypothetical protein K438DRAFT_1781986 [Mycena galopus ATCC 62051]